MKQNPNILSKFLKSERDFYFTIIDILAHEYGWSIEYIENLQLPAITGLIKVIRERKDMEDVLEQMNVAKGMAGKPSSNQRVPPTKEEKVSKEIEDLNKLSKMLHIPLQQGKSEKDS